MKNFLAAAAVLAVTVTPAFADGSGIEAGVNVGATIPASPDEFKDAADPSFSIAGWLSGPLSGVFGWRAEFGYDRFSASDEAGGDEFDADAYVTRFAGGLMLQPTGDAKSKPYGFVTAGGYRADCTGDDCGEVDSETDFGLGIGGGYNWGIGENWGLNLDLHYNIVFTEDEKTTYLVPSGGLFFRF